MLLVWLNNRITKKKKPPQINLIVLHYLTLLLFLYLLSPFQKMEISTFSWLLKCKERSGEIFSPGCSAEAVDRQLCTRLVCGIHIDVKGSSSRRTKVECASRNGAGRRQKKRGLLQFGRWRINTVSIAVRRMVWRKQLSCWFLSHPKETTAKKTPNA